MEACLLSFDEIVTFFKASDSLVTHTPPLPHILRAHPHMCTHMFLVSLMQPEWEEHSNLPEIRLTMWYNLCHYGKVLQVSNMHHACRGDQAKDNCVLVCQLYFFACFKWRRYVRGRIPKVQSFMTSLIVNDNSIGSLSRKLACYWSLLGMWGQHC